MLGINRMIKAETIVIYQGLTENKVSSQYNIKIILNLNH